MSNKVVSFIKNFINKERALKEILFLTAVVLFFTTISVNSIQLHTGTIDEKFHLTRGIMLLSTGDYRINQHHPLLFNTIQALPLLFNENVKIPETKGNRNWEEARKDELSFQMVGLNGGLIKFSDTILMPSRYLMISIATIFIPLFYLLIKKLFSPATATIATAFLSASPTFIAHSPLVTTDAPIAMMIFITTAYLALLLKRRQKPNLWESTGLLILISLSLLTKYTAVMVLPIWIGATFYLFTRGKEFTFTALKKPILKTVLFSALICLVIFAAYGFQIGTLKDMTYGHPEKIKDLENAILVSDTYLTSSSSIVRFIVEKVPLPAPQYINGFLENVISHNSVGHDSFLLGSYSEKGWRHYFIVAILLKESIGFILAMTLSILISIRPLYTNLIKKRLHSHEILMIAIPLYLFLLSVMSSINLGVRHQLPVLLFLYLFVGHALSELYKIHKKSIYLTVVLLVIAFLSIVNRYPHYIGYFNETIGKQENGYHYLRGSNFDWGQNEKYAFEYLLNKKGYVEDHDGWLQAGNSIVISKRVLDSEHERSVFPMAAWIYSKYKNGEIEPIDEVEGTHLYFEIDE